MKRILLSIGILLGISAVLAPARGAVFSGDAGPYFSFGYGAGGGIPEDVVNVTGQQISTDGQRLKLFGDLGPIDGARFADGLVLWWSAPLTGPINAGDHIVADLNFNVTATGGTLAWNFYSSSWADGGDNTGWSYTSLTPVAASGQVSGVEIQCPAFPASGNTGWFSGYLHIQWSGFSPPDTLSLSIPQDSIDFTYAPVPEPSALALLVLGLSLLVRRFRR